MTPLRPHVPPRGVGASQTTCTGPPEASTVRSLPPAKKPIDRLSGDQNGNSPCSVEGRIAVAPVESDWIHSFPEAPNTIRSPSGEIAGVMSPRWSGVPSS